MPKAHIALMVQSRARRVWVTVTVAEAGAVTVRVSAAPERGKANTAVVEVLAKALQVPPSLVEVDGPHQ